MRQASTGHRGIFPAPQKPVIAPRVHFQPPVQSNTIGYWSQETDVTASGGSITINGPGVYVIDTEGAAASDTVHTINGGYARMEIILQPKSDVRTVQIKRNTGNIYAQADFTMNSIRDRMRLLCDASLDFCEIGGRSSNG